MSGKGSHQMLLIGFWARLYFDILATLTHGRVVTIKSGPNILFHRACPNDNEGKLQNFAMGPKAYPRHLTHGQAALICGHPFEKTIFMVGKYLTKVPWPNIPTSTGNGIACGQNDADHPWAMTLQLSPRIPGPEM